MVVAAALGWTPGARAAGIPGAPPPFDKGGVKIALVNYLSTGDFFQAYEAGAQKQAKALGIDLRIYEGRQDAAEQREQIQQAISANAKLRTAALQVKARVWADATGRVTRVQIVSSSGDAELDAALNHEVLATLTLREPPPRDMPMPIVMSIVERKAG